MADPLSVVASVAGILSLGLQTTQFLLDFYRQFRDLDSDRSRTISKLEGLLQTLRIIDDVVQKQKLDPNKVYILQNVLSHLAACESVIEELKREVDKIKTTPHTNLIATVKEKGRRAAYPFRRSTLEKLNEDIADCRDSLLLALETLQLTDQKGTRDDISNIKAATRVVQTLQLKSELRTWLNAPDVSIEHGAAAAKKHPGTGLWFVEGSNFKAWMNQPNSFLWLHGFAGCGKSVLSSTVIEYINDDQRFLDGTAIAFFYFTFSDNSKQDSSALLRALLVQLSRKFKFVEDDLSALKSKLNDGTPQNSDLLQILKYAAFRADDIYLILDGLDECPQNYSRTGVIETVNNIRQWSIPSLHILTTSRNEPDISIMLQADVGQAIDMRNDEIHKDIQIFIKEKLENDLQLRRWQDCHGQDCRDMIQQSLATRSGGVFRWVECQFGPLRRCPKSIDRLKQCLNSMPRTLDETYERVLCNVDEDDREQTRRLLRLLCLSTRPLTVAELIDAIATELDSDGSFDPDKKLVDFEDLQRLCPGFIRVDQMQIDYRDTNFHEYFFDTVFDIWATFRVEVVRFAHFTVQEYLQTDRIRKSPAAVFAISSDEGHAEITKTCSTYLRNGCLLREPLTPQLLKDFPFARFAARYWPYHFTKCNAGHRKHLSEWMLPFLTTKNSYMRAMEIYMPAEILAYWNKQSDDDAQVYPSAMWYAAFSGNTNIVEAIVNFPQNVDNLQEDGGMGTALGAACLNGHLDIVDVLIQAGSRVNEPRGFRCMTPLAIASSSGRLSVVQKLLSAGADVNSRSEYDGWSPLLFASAGGHEKVVDVLLAAGAVIGARGRSQVTVLHLASISGGGTLVQRLIEAGADFNAMATVRADSCKDLIVGAPYSHNHQNPRKILPRSRNLDSRKYGISALHEAARHGNLNAMKALLEAGADANAEGRRGTPLVSLLSDGHFTWHAAGSRTFSRHSNGADMVQLLIKAGAKVNYRDGRHPLPLNAAARKGQIDAVGILIRARANVNANSTRFGTALAAASWEGHSEIVTLLLEADADPNMLTCWETYCSSKTSGTALEAASIRGHWDVVRILLSKGADIRIAGSLNPSVFYEASRAGLESMELFLAVPGLLVQDHEQQRTCIRKEKFEQKYGLALHNASHAGQESAVRVLLNTGAKVDAKTENGTTALHIACRENHVELARMLLQAGADVNTQQICCGTPLQIAVRDDYYYRYQRWRWKRHFDEAPTHYLGKVVSEIHNRRVRLVQTLIDAGADVNASGKYGTPLHSASALGKEEIVKALLSAGANPNTSMKYSVRDHRKDLMGSDDLTLIRTGIALQAAAHYGSKSIIKLLLNAGSEIDTQASCDGSALQAAAHMGHEGAVKVLLTAGADVSYKSRYMACDKPRYGSALQAAWRGAQKAQWQVEHAVRSPTVLGCACCQMRPLDRGREDTAEERRALWRSVQQDYDRVVQMLLGAGADSDEIAEVEAEIAAEYPAVRRQIPGNVKKDNDEDDDDNDDDDEEQWFDAEEWSDAEQWYETEQWFDAKEKI